MHSFPSRFLQFGIPGLQFWVIQDLLNYCAKVLICEWSVSRAASDLPTSSAGSINRSKKEFLCTIRRKKPFVKIQFLVCSLLTAGVFLFPLKPIVAGVIFWELYRIVYPLLFQWKLRSVSRLSQVCYACLCLPYYGLQDTVVTIFRKEL